MIKINTRKALLMSNGFHIYERKFDTISCVTNFKTREFSKKEERKERREKIKFIFDLPN